MENKRNFFRLDFYDLDADVYIFHRKVKARVRDVSGNGISFYAESGLSFDVCDVVFHLEEERFALSAALVRATEDAHGDSLYACTFVDIEPKTQSKMVSTLFRMDARRRKK